MFGIKVDKNELEPGDIVVFKGTRNRSGWHSGIYVGDGKFVHSPRTGKTVTETKLDNSYFAKRFAGARRIPRDGSAAELYAQHQAQQKANAQSAKTDKKSRRQPVLVATAQKSGSTNKGAARPKATASKKSGKTVAVSGKTTAGSGKGVAVSASGKTQKTKASTRPERASKKTETGQAPARSLASAGKVQKTDAPAAKKTAQGNKPAPVTKSKSAPVAKDKPSPAAKDKPASVAKKSAQSGKAAPASQNKTQSKTAKN